MSKLLRSNLSRLKKYSIFWIALAVVLVWAALCMVNYGRTAAHFINEGYSNYRYIDTHYFNLCPFLGIFTAIVISLFLGTEYSDGTIRNKLIVGHTRTAIYIANLITCFVISVAVTAALFIGGLAGLFMPALDGWQMSVGWILIYILMCLLYSAVLAAIFTLIAMLSPNKAGTVVITLVTFLALLICASSIYNMLSEEELISGMVITEKGMEISEPHPNPQYVGGMARQVLSAILNILPTGPAIYIANLEITEPIFPSISAVLLTVVVTVIGLAVFRKKDLK